MEPKRPLGFGSGWKGSDQHLAGTADPSPFPDEAGVAEEVGLNIEVIEPPAILGRIDQAEGDGGHGDTPVFSSRNTVALLIARAAAISFQECPAAFIALTIPTSTLGLRPL